MESQRNKRAKLDSMARITSLESSYESTDERLSGLELNIQILNVKFNIINNWMESLFGIQLFNKNSPLFKLHSQNSTDDDDKEIELSLSALFITDKHKLNTHSIIEHLNSLIQDTEVQTESKGKRVKEKHVEAEQVFTDKEEQKESITSIGVIKEEEQEENEDVNPINVVRLKYEDDTETMLINDPLQDEPTNLSMSSCTTNSSTCTSNNNDLNCYENFQDSPPVVLDLTQSSNISPSSASPSSQSQSEFEKFMLKALPYKPPGQQQFNLRHPPPPPPSILSKPSTSRKSPQQTRNIHHMSPPHSPTSKSSSPARHIKRPLNPFMVWSQAQRQTIMKNNPEILHSDISAYLGSQWKLLSDAEREPFRKKAEELKAAHEKAFPNYKYKPGPRRRSRGPGKPPKDPLSVPELALQLKLQQQQTPRPSKQPLLSPRVDVPTGSVSLNDEEIEAEVKRRRGKCGVCGVDCGSVSATLKHLRVVHELSTSTGSSLFYKLRPNNVVVITAKAKPKSKLDNSSSSSSGCGSSISFDFNRSEDYVRQPPPWRLKQMHEEEKELKQQLRWQRKVEKKDVEVVELEEDDDDDDHDDVEENVLGS